MNNSKSVTSLVDSRCGVWGVSHQVPNLTSALLTDDPVVSGVAIVLALWWGQAVLIPVVLSVLISYALEPLIARLECWRVKRVIAVPLVLTVLLAAAGSGAYALRGEAVAFVNRLSGAAHKVAQAIQAATRETPGTMARARQTCHPRPDGKRSAQRRRGAADRGIDFAT